MASMFSSISDKFKAFWQQSSIMQRSLVLGLAVLTIAVFVGLTVWMNQPDYRVLYANLSPEDASRVVTGLQADKTPYKLENNGQTILVPADKVYDLRLKVAGDGSITGQGVGFEIFDNIKVGETAFVQKINYQRALQGELTRTLSEFPGVESARVHLVVPQHSLFIEEQQPPSASVVLKLAEGRSLNEKDVQAVVNLLVMAVEGLDKSHISVSDSNGKVLYYPPEEGSVAGMSNTQLEHKATVQRDLERRIEDMLAPIIGPGKVIARVNADLDFSQKTIRKELFDPDKTVLRSESRSEESTKGQSTLDSGVPDANFRGDNMSGGLSEQESTRETRTNNFEINKEEQNIIASVGDVTRLSVAVIVDGTYVKNEETGEMMFTPRSDEELARINQLVANAVGFDRARGDTIEVSSISFGGPDLAFEPQLSDMIMDYATRLGKPIMNSVLVLLFLLLVVRPIVLAMIRPRVQGELIEGLEGLPAGEDRLALIEADEEMDALDALKKIEDVKAHTLQLCEQNMEQAISILRGWIKDREGADVGRAA